MTQSLHRLLDNLQEQAELDSSGAFTLDPARARELLRNSQLANPHHYILCLVSALIGFGASSLRVTQSNTGLRIQAPGAVIAPELMANPLGGLFSRSQPALREWAVGVNSVLGLSGASLVVDSSNGRQGRYQGDHYQVKETAASEPPRTEMQILRQLSNRTPWSLELAALVSEFRHCPIDLDIDGVRISQPIQVPAASWTIWQESRRAGAGNGLRFAPCEGLQSSLHGAPLQALIAVGGDQSSCNWLFLGRNYSRPLPFVLQDSDLHLQVWVSCDQVDKDLSQSHLLDNDRYQKVCNFLKQCFLEAVDDFLEQLLSNQLSLSQVQLSRPFIVYTIETYARRQDWEPAIRLQTILSQGPQKPPERKIDEYRMLLLCAGRSGLGGAELAHPLDETNPDLDSLWAVVRCRLAVSGPKSPVTLAMLLHCGQRAYAEGRHDLGIKCLQPFVAATPDQELACAKLGSCYLALGQVSQARHYLSQSITPYHGKKSVPDWFIGACENLALAEAQLGNLQIAATTLAEVLRRRQLEWGSHSRRLGLILNRLVVLCQQLKDEKTAKYYQRWSLSLYL